MKTFRPYEPDQMLLMPPSLSEWVPEDHLARFVGDLLDTMDLSAIEDAYDEERGYPPYHPCMMTKVLLYAYCTGTYSSRRMAAKLHDSVAYRFLAAGNQPDFRTISDFRKRHEEALSGLFEQVLVICRESGLVKLGRVAVDGTKIKANASKHKAMSYGRMDELPEELARRESRLKKIREAKAALEAAAKKKAAAEGKDPERSKPAAKDQHNFTDPESKIQKTNDGFIQGYNAQVAVDETFQVIVAQHVTTANDVNQLQPVVESIASTLKNQPKEVLADAGYCSEDNIRALEKKGIEPFIATSRQKHGERRPSPRGRAPKGMTLCQRMARKLLTARGQKAYSQRKVIVEPVFGQIKQARRFRQFLRRGVRRVRHEWSLVCTAHNILKLRTALMTI